MIRRGPRAAALIVAALLAAALLALPARSEGEGAAGGDPIVPLLPQDAIRSIDRPELSGADAPFMRDDEPVVGVVLDGVARAYSLWHLDRHEIVNDTIARHPIAITW